MALLVISDQYLTFWLLKKIDKWRCASLPVNKAAFSRKSPNSFWQQSRQIWQSLRNNSLTTWSYWCHSNTNTKYTPQYRKIMQEPKYIICRLHERQSHCLHNCRRRCGWRWPRTRGISRLEDDQGRRLVDRVWEVFTYRYRWVLTRYSSSQKMHLNLSFVVSCTRISCVIKTTCRVLNKGPRSSGCYQHSPIICPYFSILCCARFRITTDLLSNCFIFWPNWATIWTKHVLSY